jgi:hypothetical protein
MHMSNLPPWLWMTLVVLDFVIPFGLLLAGVFLVYRNWNGGGTDGALVCAKCGYDMRAAVTLECPDCGHMHKHKREMRPVSIWPKVRIALGLVLMIPGVWVLCFSLWYYPRTYLRNRENRAIMAGFTVPPAAIRHMGPAMVSIESPMPFWTKQMAEMGWSMGNAQLIAYGGGGFPSLHAPRNYSGAPGVPLFHTVCSWTWAPSLNYMSYMPDETCVRVTIDGIRGHNGSTPTVLTPAQAKALATLPGLNFIHLGRDVVVDDQTLVEFAKMASAPGTFRVMNYRPDPAQAGGWDKVSRLEGPTALDVNGPPPLGFFKVLSKSVMVQSLTITDGRTHANPGENHGYVSDGSLGEGLKLLATRRMRNFVFDAGTPQERAEAFRVACKISGLTRLKIIGVELGGTELAPLSKQAQLEYLRLDFAPGCKIQDADVQAMLAGLKDLRVLSLANLPECKGRFLKWLPRNVSGLCLNGIPLGEGDLAALHGDRIYDLELNECGVSLASLKALIPHLKDLSTLALDEPVDAEFCQLLTKQQGLGEVALVGVDDEGLKALLAHPSLESITLNRPKLSAQGEALVKASQSNQSSGKDITIVR